MRLLTTELPKPEEGGLFCERIFGPQKSFQCRCGKKQSGNKGQICVKMWN